MQILIVFWEFISLSMSSSYLSRKEIEEVKFGITPHNRRISGFGTLEIKKEFIYGNNFVMIVVGDEQGKSKDEQ